MAYIQQQLPDTTWMTVSSASLNTSPRQEATVDVLAENMMLMLLF